MSDTPLARFDPTDPAFRADPYPTYRRYRAADPVHLGVPPIPSMPRCHYVFRHADVAALLRDARLGRARLRAGAARPDASTVIRKVARQMLLFTDPPRHARIRALMEAAFSPELHARARLRAEALAPVLLEMALAEESPDLVSGFAVPLPVLVMSEVLGIPEQDRPLVKRWSADIVAITDLRSSGAALARASRATAEVADYLAQLIRDRRRAPGECVLSRLITSRVEGEALSDDEILANAILFLAAGHETTVGLISEGILALLEHPDEAARLASDLALATKAVEELLRYTSPVQITFRVAHEALTVRDHAIAPGDAVALVLASANRDPDEFTLPERLQLTRATRRHLSFGSGAHHCLGSTVARVEAKAAFTAAAPLLAGMTYDLATVTRSGNFVFRALDALPVRMR